MLYWFPVFPGTEVLGIYLFYSELHTIKTPKASEFLHNIPKTLGYLFWPQQSSMNIFSKDSHLFFPKLDTE